MFEPLAIPESRPIAWLKRLFVFVIVTFLAIGMVSLIALFSRCEV